MMALTQLDSPLQPSTCLIVPLIMDQPTAMNSNRQPQKGLEEMKLGGLLHATAKT